ncbi:diguanylate cyclase [Micrococcales bacterium 31B]|nr:diguanylate cyclase [Micrococcales bacterium 31B]
MRNRFDRALEALSDADSQLPNYFHDAAEALATLFPNDRVAFVNFPTANEDETGTFYAPTHAEGLVPCETAPLREWPRDLTGLPADDRLSRALLPGLAHSDDPVTTLFVPLQTQNDVTCYFVVLRVATPELSTLDFRSDPRVSPQDPIRSPLTASRARRARAQMPSTQTPYWSQRPTLTDVVPTLAGRANEPTAASEVTTVEPPNLPLGWHAHEHGAAALLARYCEMQVRTCLLQRSLAEAEDLRSIAFRHLDQGIFILRPDLTILAVNPAGAALGGLRPEELIGNRLVDLNIQMWVKPGVPLPVDEVPVVASLRENRTVVSDILYITTGTGLELWTRVSATPTHNAQGEPIVVVVTRDHTEEQRMVHALKRRESQLLAAQQLAKLELWSWDATNNQIIFDAFQSDVLREFAPKGRISTEMFLAAAGVGSEVYGQILLKVLIEGKRCTFDFQFDRSDGGKNTWRVWIIPELDEAGNVIDIWGTGLDISHERQVQSELQRLALHDTLTSLANRTHLQERLVEVLQRTEAGRFAALIMIDLDDFKGVNDTYGHNAGDDLLQQVAQRIQDASPSGSLAARLGGDEFVILVEGLESGDAAVEVAHRVHETLQVPFTIQDARQPLEHHASIGLAYTDQAQRPADDFMRDADLAMYDSKSRGGNHIVVFHHGLREAADRRHMAESVIREAFDGGRVEGRFQPIMRLSDQRVTGGEAVAGILKGDAGEWSLIEFASIAEGGVLGAAIDSIVLKEAISVINEWAPDNPAEDVDMCLVGANLSPLTLEVPDAYASIKESLREIKRPDLFVLEISSHTKTSSDPDLMDRLEPLKQLGIQLLLDDFGVGYSSFAHMRHRSVDLVKIDASFSENIAHDPVAAAELNAMVALCLSRGHRCILAGIDTPEQFKVALASGATHVQGSFVGDALKWQDFRATYIHPSAEVSNTTNLDDHRRAKSA